MLLHGIAGRRKEEGCEGVEEECVATAPVVAVAALIKNNFTEGRILSIKSGSMSSPVVDLYKGSCVYVLVQRFLFVL